MKKMIAYSTCSMQDFSTWIIEESQWHSVEPLPEDLFEITVKDEFYPKAYRHLTENCNKVLLISGNRGWLPELFGLHYGRLLTDSERSTLLYDVEGEHEAFANSSERSEAEEDANALWDELLEREFTINGMTGKLKDDYDLYLLVDYSKTPE